MRIAALCAIVISIAVIVLAWTTYVPAAAQVVEAVPVVVEQAVVIEPVTVWDTIQDVVWTAVLTFGGGLVLLLTGYVWKAFPRLATVIGDEGRERVNQLLRNGLFWLAEQQKKGLKLGMTPAEGAIAYARMHGLDAKVKALGDNPRSPETEAAMEARVGKMLADPAVVTPPEFTPPEGKAVVAAVASPVK